MSNFAIAAGVTRRLPRWLRQRIANFARDWTRRERFDWRGVLVVLVGTLLLFPLTSRLPALGYEWHSYDRGVFNGNYPPWLPMVTAPLTVWDWRTGMALLVGLLMMTTAVATAREARGEPRGTILGAALLALMAGPVFIVGWLGNASIITLFGVFALPFGVPFATVQPHLGPWALLARRQWMLWGLGFLSLSLIVWGLWPQRYFDLSGLLAHPIAMGWQNLGLPVLVLGLAMLCFTNADPLRLMAVGAFLMPYVMPGHLVMLVPAIGRVRGYWRLVLWLASWLTFLPSMFAPALWSKYGAMLFPLLVWLMLRPQQSQPGDEPTSAL